MSSRLLRSPVVVIGARDAQWIADALEYLARVGHFAGAPALGERAVELVDDLSCVLGHASTDGQQLLSYKDAARSLGVSLSSVRRYVSSGRLPAVRVGGSVRIERSALEQFVEVA